MTHLTVLDGGGVAGRDASPNALRAPRRERSRFDILIPKLTSSVFLIGKVTARNRESGHDVDRLFERRR